MNCPQCSINFGFVHICRKAPVSLRWYNGQLRITLLEPQYIEYEFSCSEENAQENINKFINNLIFI